MIKKVINLANKLDKAGYHREAGAVDGLLEELARLLDEDIALDLGARPDANESGDKEDESGDKDDKDDESGDQVTFKDYTTENFDICQGAVAAFSKLKEMDLDDDPSDLTMASIQTTDDLLGLEKRILKEDSATDKDLGEAIDLARNISHYSGVLSTMLEADLSADFEFVDMHVQKIAEVALK